MLKVLFLHGFFASGQCVPANALRDALDGKAVVQYVSADLKKEAEQKPIMVMPEDPLFKEDDY